MSRLGGWWRLWIVLTVLWVGFACIAAWPSRTELPINVLAGHQLDNLSAELRLAKANTDKECVAGTISTTTTRRFGDPFDAFGAPAADPKNPMQAAPPAPPASYFVATRTCITATKLVDFLTLAVGIPIALAVAGLAVRWIYCGFRRPSPI